MLSKKVCKNHYRRMLPLAPSCPASPTLLPPPQPCFPLFTADQERGAGKGVKIKTLTVISFREPLLEQCNMIKIIALTFCYFFEKQAVGCQLCTLSRPSSWCSLLDFVTVLNLLSNHSKFGLLRCTDQTYWKLKQWKFFYISYGLKSMHCQQINNDCPFIAGLCLN